MKTITDVISESADVLRGLIEDLVRRHSSVYLSNPRGSGIIDLSGNHRWRELSTEGRRLQAKLLEEYRRFAALIDALLREQAADTRDESAEAHRNTLAVIEQQGNLWPDNSEEPLAEALEGLVTQVRLLGRLYSNSDIPIFIPDTNALLYNPALEQWSFPGVLSFMVILTPTVTSELDRLKVEHRNRSVRDRAERIVRQIKEYRRRGPLTEGVPLGPNSRIQALGVEPDIGRSLPWLDRSNSDDRVLASVIEVIRQHPRSPVSLITRDLNLQNKAEFARIPFLEPPEAGKTKAKGKP